MLLRWLIALLIPIALLRAQGILAARTDLRVGTNGLTTIRATYHEHPHFRTRGIRRRPEAEFRSQHARRQVTIHQAR
jgi:hypothetical protein